MSQQELNIILDMMRNFPWGETPTEMRASFNDSARSLPPMLIHVGNQEVLLDDSLRLARKAALDDVSVELKVWKDMIHSLHLFGPMLTEGREAIASSGAFLARYLGSKF